MRKLIITAILILSSMQVVYSQSGWFWQNPLPQGNWLNSIDTISPNRLIAVGMGSTIIQSSNSGITWGIQHLTTGLSSREFFSVRFINQNTGWICGDSGAVLKTINGGSNWNWQTTNTNKRLRRLFFVNSQTGYACGDRGVVLKTTNGGINWIYSIVGSASNYYRDLFFTNANTGYICGFKSWSPTQGKLFKTTSGGSNWFEIGISYNNGFTSLHFLNDQTGYIAGDGVSNSSINRLFKTTNSGVNWNEIDIGLQDNIRVRGVYYKNENIGILNTDIGVRKTTDGGTSWFWLYQMSGSTCDWGFSQLKFFSDTLFFGVVCYKIFKSFNSGNNMTEISNGHRNGLTCIQFIDANTGWALSYLGIYKSTNGGTNWQFYDIPGTISGYRFQFINANTGWIFRYPLLKTVNGGYNWYADSTFTYAKNLFFLNQTIGYIISDSSSTSKLYKTINSGLTWFNIFSCDSKMEGFQFIDSNIGYSLKEYPLSVSYKLMKTTNGGYNWLVHSTAEIRDPRTYIFINENTGWLSKRTSNTGFTESIYKTTNGGISWINQNLDYYNLYNIRIHKFLNSNTGIATATSQHVINSATYLLSTTNSGQNWEINYFGITLGILDMFFLDSNTGWAVGGGGTILKTTNGGIFHISKINNNLPVNHFLHQNYPNPFNPKTKIKFDLPKSTHARLIIYDILGREIATLLNEKLSAGSYEVSWSAGSYPSGVYFYKLETNNFVDIKKMLLIK